MKNYISELIKEIFSEINKILNYKNNKDKYLYNHIGFFSEFNNLE